MLNFEKRYNYIIVNKITKMEDFVNDVALEQARLLERFIRNENRDKMFPKNMEGS